MGSCLHTVFHEFTSMLKILKIIPDAFLVDQELFHENITKPNLLIILSFQHRYS